MPDRPCITDCTIPDDVDAPVTVEVKLQYRKFDQQYMDFVDKANEKLGKSIRGHQPGEPYRNELPIVTLASDRITFPVEGLTRRWRIRRPTSREWQRWNDYGIGLLLKGKAAIASGGGGVPASRSNLGSLGRSAESDPRLQCRRPAR